jgi:hypothetical protein
MLKINLNILINDEMVVGMFKNEEWQILEQHIWQM